jgi:hypothetical protein
MSKKSFAAAMLCAAFWRARTRALRSRVKSRATGSRPVLRSMRTRSASSPERTTTRLAAIRKMAPAASHSPTARNTSWVWSILTSSIPATHAVAGATRIGGSRS